MQAKIHKYQPESEFLIPEGCYIIESSNDDNDPQLSIAQARVEPGVTTQWHRLRDTVERYVILSGTGIMEVGDLAPTAVKRGDVVIIPPMYRQRITNDGTDDLIFLALCTPGFRDDAYELIEE